MLKSDYCTKGPEHRHDFVPVTEPHEPKEPEEAKRDEISVRYDIIDPDFLELMAKIADYGAKKYGDDFNWQKSRLEGNKSPINHIYQHLMSYRIKEPYDHTEVGEHFSLHLVAIAFNAMMEFYYEKKK
jgi:hypothetical protein